MPAGVAEGAAGAGLPHDLAAVIDAWPNLPDAIRRAVMALVDSVNGVADGLANGAKATG